MQANVGHEVTCSLLIPLFLFTLTVGKTPPTDESRVKNQTKITMT
jgi:hypothetical protein